MSKKNYLFLFIIAVTLCFSCVAVKAQESVGETNTVSAESDAGVLENAALETAADEQLGLEIKAEELNISEPGPFYWLKNLSWDIQALLTKDPIKKSEIKLKKASSQLLRIKNLIEKNPNDSKLQDQLEKINQNYKKTIDDINTRLEKARAENPETPQLKDFLDKYTKQQLLHQEILNNLENKVPEKVMEIIRANRQESLQKFGELMNRLQNKEELKARLKDILENQKESVERRAQNLKIIDELKTKVIPEIKEKINEFKNENKNIIQSLKAKQEDLRQKKQELLNKLKAKKQEEVREKIKNIQPEPEVNQ